MSAVAVDHPSFTAAALQRRVRRLTRLLRNPELHAAEIDGIATDLGDLSMRLEAFEPAGRTWRAPRRA